MIVRPFEPRDEDVVVALWREAGLTRPWNDPHRDIQRKLTTQPDLFLVVQDADRIIATTMVGYDGHRGWVYYLAAASDRRGEGLGRLLVDEAERLLLERGCPKVMLMARADNEQVIELYEHLGYARETVAVLGKRLIPDA